MKTSGSVQAWASRQDLKVLDTAGRASDDNIGQGFQTRAEVNVTTRSMTDGDR